MNLLRIGLEAVGTIFFCLGLIIALEDGVVGALGLLVCALGLTLLAARLIFYKRLQV